MPITWLDEAPKITWLDDDGAQDRIDQAFVDASDENQPEIVRGSILPFSRVGDDVRFDPNTGIVGAIRSGIELAGDVSSGGTPIFDEGGRISQEAIRRSVDTAALGIGGVLSRAAPATSKAISQAAKKSIQEADEFAIPLSRGQATKDFNTQAFEEDALTGGRGAGAQAVLQRQREAQSQAVDSAAEDILKRASRSDIDDTYEAAENIGGAVSRQARSLRDESDGLYKSAEGADAEINPAAIEGLENSFKRTLDEMGGLEGTQVAAEYPTAARALKRVQDMMSKAPEGEVTGIGWQNFERVRRILNKSGSSQDEKRILSGMRQSFDDWLENSVENALVSGDPKFLSDLQQARHFYREYKRIADSDIGIIKKMADGSTNAEQISNYLYGASRVGGRADSSNIVREIKGLIGEDNAAIDDLKRGVLMRLFNDRKGDRKTYGKLAGDILEFTSGKGRELAKELYGPESIKEFRRFADVLRKLTTDEIATNPSRSGQTLSRRLSGALNSIAPFVGYTAAGLWGAIGGLGLTAIGKASARAKAKRLASEPLPGEVSRLAPRSTFVQGARGLIATDQLQEE